MTKPSEPKVWRGWAVYWPDGRLCYSGLISRLRRDCIRAADDCFNEPWPELRRRGFRCLPITITPEE